MFLTAVGRWSCSRKEGRRPPERVGSGELLFVAEVDFDSDVVAPYQLYFVCTVKSTVLSRPSPRLHLHHNSTHSSFFTLLSPLHSSYSVQYALYSTASQTSSRHLSLYLFLTSYTRPFLRLCSAVLQSVQLLSCSSYLSVLVLYDYFWPFRSRFHQPYQPNLTARYLASRRSRDDPAMIQQ